MSINHVDMEQVNLEGEQQRTNLSQLPEDEDEHRLLSNNSVNSGSLENSEPSNNTDVSSHTMNFNKSSQNLQENSFTAQSDLPMNYLGK